VSGFLASIIAFPCLGGGVHDSRPRRLRHADGVLYRESFFAGEGIILEAIIGGLALTLVYMFVVVPLKTSALPPNMGGLFIIGFLLNAAWGIGWALLLMVFDRLRGQPITAW